MAHNLTALQQTERKKSNIQLFCRILAGVFIVAFIYFVVACLIKQSQILVLPQKGPLIFYKGFVFRVCFLC